MSVRTYLNENSKIVVCIICGVIALVLGISAYRAFSSDSGGSPTNMFYTDDDGSTTFVDAASRLPPFEHNGKTAVRARVFTKDGGHTQFVGYLERYTPEAIKKLEAADANRKSGKKDALTPDSQDILLNGTEVKKPGDAKWVSPKDRAGRNRVVTILPPGDTTADSVFP